MDVAVRTRAGAAASNSSVSMCRSADVGSKSDSNLEKAMEVGITSIPTDSDNRPITKSCHEPLRYRILQGHIANHLPSTSQAGPEPTMPARAANDCERQSSKMQHPTPE